jgi:pimeloyl-ACP methyl ester carboxylesterase
MQAPEDPDLRRHIARVWGDVCAPGFAAAHVELLDDLADQVVRRPTPRALLLLQLRAISGWSGAARLAAITAPTTVVHGAADPLMPVGNGMRLAQLIPGARYVELAAVGHLVAHEDPDTLTSIIREGAT